MAVSHIADARDGGDTLMNWDVIAAGCDHRGATTDEQRAELLGVDRRTIIRWRHGQTGARLSTAHRVARALGVSLDDLIGGTA